MKPEGPVFDRAWRRSCRVAPINKKLIGDLVLQHYLHEWPKEIQLAFGLKRRGKLLGVITYSAVVGETRDRFGPQTWELSRLIVIDRVPPNAESFFIAATIRYIKQHYSTLQRLVSFADPRHGHRGTVYKASNWTQVEHRSKNLFVFDLTARQHPPPCAHVSDGRLWTTGSRGQRPGTFCLHVSALVGLRSPPLLAASTRGRLRRR